MNIQTVQLGNALKQASPYAAPMRQRTGGMTSGATGQASMGTGPGHLPFWPTRTEFMAIFAEMKKIFSADDMKKSKKRDALKKSLVKLESKGDILRQALKEASSKKKQKDLETKLETNLRHQKKARALIKELG